MIRCNLNILLLLVLLSNLSYASSSCSITSRKYKFQENSQVVQELVVRGSDEQSLCSDYYGGQDSLYKCLEKALVDLRCDIKLVRPIRYIEVEANPWDDYCGAPMC